MGSRNPRRWRAKLPGNPQQEIRKKKGRLGRPERRAARKRADWVSFNPAAPP
jgi:hypothetical protein